MSRPFHKISISILETLSEKGSDTFEQLHKTIAKDLPYKTFYNFLYRLINENLVVKTKNTLGLSAEITDEGKKLLFRMKPKKDGVWKLVIFDIPEKHLYVRNVLRAKLKTLGFKKWQNSIWVSPFALDEEIEQEMKTLASKFFVRLIKTKDINETSDLEKMF